MGIEMRTEHIDQAGDDLGTLADAAGQRATSLFHLSDVAAQNHPGWVSSASLANCRTVWEERVQRTLRTTAEMGEALAGSAGAVAGGESEATSRLREVLGGFDK